MMGRLALTTLFAPLVVAVGKVLGGAVVAAVWMAQGRFTPAPTTIVSAPVAWAGRVGATVRDVLVGVPELSLLVVGAHVLGLAGAVVLYWGALVSLPRYRRRRRAPPADLRGVQR